MKMFPSHGLRPVEHMAMQGFLAFQNENRALSIYSGQWLNIYVFYRICSNIEYGVFF